MLIEQAMVWNQEGSREVPTENGHRDYGELTEDDVPGTADLILIDEDGGLAVWDYKTGKTILPEPEKNYQLLHLATMASELYAPWPDGVKVGLQFIRPDGDVISHWGVIDWFDLEQHRDKLRAALAAPLDEYNPGPIQCKYCPGKKHCPIMGDKEIDNGN